MVKCGDTQSMTVKKWDEPIRYIYIYIYMYIIRYIHEYDGLSKCLFPVLLINRNSMRAASCLPLKKWPTLMTLKRGNSSLPLEIFLKPQESANARRFHSLSLVLSPELCVSVCVPLWMQYASWHASWSTLFPHCKLPKREHGCASEWAAGGPGHVFAIFASALLAAI